MKICTRCKQEKPLEQFYRIATSKDGHRTQCKTCSDQWKLDKKNGVEISLLIQQNIFIENDICKIEINSSEHGQYFAIVDKDDYALIKKYNWSLDRDKYVLTYSTIGKHKRMKLHRYLTNCPDNMVVDHINHQPLDNRRSNLRICTQKENVRNQRKYPEGRTSKYKGVHWNKAKNKWHAQIKIRPKTIYLGLYNHEDDAAEAYNAAATKYFGEFACLNETKE